MMARPGLARPCMGHGQLTIFINSAVSATTKKDDYQTCYPRGRYCGQLVGLVLLYSALASDPVAILTLRSLRGATAFLRRRNVWPGGLQQPAAKSAKSRGGVQPSRAPRDRVTPPSSHAQVVEVAQPARMSRLRGCFRCVRWGWSGRPCMTSRTALFARGTSAEKMPTGATRHFSCISEARVRA